MRKYQVIKTSSNFPKIFLFIIWLLMLLPSLAEAQLKPEKPPKPIAITVSLLQHLDFGKIIPSGFSGTVTVPPVGSPSTTGDVFLISSTTPGLFDVEALPGTLISIGFPSSVTLTSSGTGTLNLGGLTSDHSPSFIAISDHTFVYVGGTLDINSLAANPPGTYGGTMLVTFTQIHQ